MILGVRTKLVRSMSVVISLRRFSWMSPSCRDRATLKIGADPCGSGFTRERAGAGSAKRAFGIYLKASDQKLLKA
jgi:hypothetical protein